MSIEKGVCPNLWRRFQALQNSCCGQDLIEYALMAGLVATGVVTMSPATATAFVNIMSKVNLVITAAGNN